MSGGLGEGRQGATPWSSRPGRDGRVHGLRRSEHPRGLLGAREEEQTSGRLTRAARRRSNEAGMPDERPQRPLATRPRPPFGGYRSTCGRPLILGQDEAVCALSPTRSSPARWGTHPRAGRGASCSSSARLEPARRRPSWPRAGISMARRRSQGSTAPSSRRRSGCRSSSAPARASAGSSAPRCRPAACRSAGGRILLLDEIEKAHPRVSDYLLGIEEAAVTLASGETLDLSGLHVVATSNVGSAGVIEMEGVARSSVRRYVGAGGRGCIQARGARPLHVSPRLLPLGPRPPGADLRADAGGRAGLPVLGAFGGVWPPPPRPRRDPAGGAAPGRARAGTAGWAPGQCATS